MNIKIKSFVKNEYGQVMVFIAISFVFLLSLASLAVDIGINYYRESKLQTAVDAAALAAAHDLPNTEKAIKTVHKYIKLNNCSTENVQVNFLENNTKIRVSVTETNDNFFATIFKEKKSTIYANAAAKINKKKSDLSFGYLIFSGSKYVNLDLGGKYYITGSIHANAGANIDGNTAARVIGSVEACHTASSINNLVTGELKSNAKFLDMPDYDEDIMALCPTFPDAVFNIKNSWPIPATTCYMTNVHQNSSQHYTQIATTTNPLSIDKSIYVPDSFTNGWLTTTVYGSVYSYGNTIFGKSVTIHNNLFVDGNLTSSGGTTMIIGGDLYCTGDLIMSGPMNVIKGNIYCEGNIILNGAATFNITGNIYCKGNVNMGVSPKQFAGGIYTMGTTTISGTSDIYGDVFSGGDLIFTGMFPSVTTHGGAIYTGGSFRAEQGFNTTGIFVAENDITVGGLPSTLTSQSSLSLYSRNGNIFMSPGTGMLAYGMVYAPKGKISFCSGEMTFYGNIIANTIDCRPGGLTLGENVAHPLPFAGKMINRAILVE